MQTIFQNPLHKFEKIYTESRAKIFNYIKKRVNSREDAEDITQDVFYKVFRKLGQFKDTGVKVESWVFTIAKNAIIDYSRKQKRQSLTILKDEKIEELASSDDDLLTKTLEGEQESILFKAISNLPDLDQYLVYYKYFAELSLLEIAAKTGLTQDNVGIKLHRLRKKLTGIIKNEYINTSFEKFSAFAAG